MSPLAMRILITLLIGIVAVYNFVVPSAAPWTLLGTYAVMIYNIWRTSR